MHKTLQGSADVEQFDRDLHFKEANNEVGNRSEHGTTQLALMYSRVVVIPRTRNALW